MVAFHTHKKDYESNQLSWEQREAELEFQLENLQQVVGNKRVFPMRLGRGLEQRGWEAEWETKLPDPQVCMHVHVYMYVQCKCMVAPTFEMSVF